MSNARRFIALRDQLLELRGDWAGARREFRWQVFAISGKIRRVELRQLEQARPAAPTRRPQEFWEEDLAHPPHAP